MTVTALIPGLGADRFQRAPLPSLESDAPAKEAGPVTAVAGRVPPVEDAGASARTQSGLGDSAQQNLFRSGTAPQSGSDGLTEAEEEQVRELKARDTEVRRHEEAHARVGGQYAGQPTYSFQTGPDGKRYAVGGEVSIDIAPIPDDPQATIAKMDVVIAAALAPAEPSGQDRKVAAQAARQRVEASADLAEQRAERFNGGQRPEPALPGTLQKIDAAGREPDFDLAA